MIGECLFFLAAAAGATRIITRGRIFNAIRPRAKYWHCAMCIGVPIGAAIMAGMMLLGMIPTPSHWWQTAILLAFGGFANSEVSYVLTSLVDDDGIRTNL